MGKKTFLVRGKSQSPPMFRGSKVIHKRSNFKNQSKSPPHNIFLHFEEHTALSNWFWECRMFSDFRFLHFLCKFAFSREIGPWEKKSSFSAQSTPSCCDQNMNIHIDTSVWSKRYIENDICNNQQQQNNSKKNNTTNNQQQQQQTKTQPLWYFVQWHQQL